MAIKRLKSANLKPTPEEEIMNARSVFRTTHLLHLAIVSVAMTVHAESIVLFSSGVDNTGTPLPGGASDPHWTIVSGPGIGSPVPAVVLDSQFAFGYVQNAASRWVWVNASGVAGVNSNYTFRLNFDLTGLDPRTAVITGQWAADNHGFIRLNGSTNTIGSGTVSLVYPNPLNTNFTTLHAFVLTNGFIPGTNTLEFVVTDEGVGGGLNIAGLSGTAELPTIALFNSGVDNTGTPLPGGASDPHWTITSGPGIGAPVSAVVLSDQIGYDYAQNSTSRWVWANASGVAGFNSDYTFRLNFDLTGLDPRTAVVSGQWAVDNVGFIRLNGSTNNIGTGVVSLLQVANGNFENLYGFTLTNGFTSGVNVLEFVITDTGVGGGLNVTGLTGAARGLPPTYMTIRISQVEVCWQSALNFQYQVQYRSSLTTNQWVDLGSPILGDGTTKCITDAIVEGQAQRFYRVETLP